MREEGTVNAEQIVITRVGGPAVLQIRPCDVPPPGPGQVAVDVRAAGVNFADVYCRLGLYKAAPPIPFVPGFEVAGAVEAVGEGVTEYAPGDRVMAVSRFGGYASRLNARAEWTRPLPGDWSYEEGAAFPVVFLTAWHGLVHVGRLREGERVVVHSAAGGVGTAACQIVRALGGETIGTVGSKEKVPVALEHGAGHVLVAADYDVWDGIERITGGEGVDIVFDAVGGPGLRRGYEALREDGRLVTYGFASMMPKGGVRNWPRLAWQFLRLPRFSPLPMTFANRTVAGFNLVNLTNRPELFALEIARLLDLAGDGKLRPVVGRTFSFRDAPAAHEFIQTRRSTGKLVLVR